MNKMMKAVKALTSKVNKNAPVDVMSVVADILTQERNLDVAATCMKDAQTKLMNHMQSNKMERLVAKMAGNKVVVFELKKLQLTDRPYLEWKVLEVEGV